MSRNCVEIQARVAEAWRIVAAAGEPEDAMRGARRCRATVREAGLIYWRDLRAYGPVSQPRGSHGGVGPARWWSGVEQRIERGEEPLVAAGRRGRGRMDRPRPNR